LLAAVVLSFKARKTMEGGCEEEHAPTPREKSYSTRSRVGMGRERKREEEEGQ
jgi:hypothetical protein